ncbi:uncharacterized protein LOC141913270 [Tubulanus polymorphus]|uniref:uncharacterized protein LOC141913270 n=1 Tax=Tubulanus polymorphus TaxID=672921 RepID=UPI003DA60F29
MDRATQILPDDTPRTRQIKDIRQKRLAYFEPKIQNALSTTNKKSPQVNPTNQSKPRTPRTPKSQTTKKNGSTKSKDENVGRNLEVCGNAVGQKSSSRKEVKSEESEPKVTKPALNEDRNVRVTKPNVNMDRNVRVTKPDVNEDRNVRVTKSAVNEDRNVREFSRAEKNEPENSDLEKLFQSFSRRRLSVENDDNSSSEEGDDELSSSELITDRPRRDDVVLYRGKVDDIHEKPSPLVKRHENTTDSRRKFDVEKNRDVSSAKNLGSRRSAENSSRNVDEFFRYDPFERTKKYLNFDARESVESFTKFGSEITDCDDLGLSTHRPESTVDDRATETLYSDGISTVTMTTNSNLIPERNRYARKVAIDSRAKPSQGERTINDASETRKSVEKNVSAKKSISEPKVSAKIERPSEIVTKSDSRQNKPPPMSSYQPQKRNAFSTDEIYRQAEQQQQASATLDQGRHYHMEEVRRHHEMHQFEKSDKTSMSSLDRYFTSLKGLNMNSLSENFEPIPEWSVEKESNVGKLSKSIHEFGGEFSLKQNETTSKKDGEKFPVKSQSVPRISGYKPPRQMAAEFDDEITRSNHRDVTKSKSNNSFHFMDYKSRGGERRSLEFVESGDVYRGSGDRGRPDDALLNDPKSQEFLQQLLQTDLTDSARDRKLQEFLKYVRTTINDDDPGDARKSVRTPDPRPVSRNDTRSSFNRSTGQSVDATTDNGTTVFTKVSGLTDKLEKLGIDIGLINPLPKTSTLPFLDDGRNLPDPLRKHEAHFNVGDHSADAQKVAIVCPDCSTLNRPYVTWCLDCGCVLIGIQPTSVPSRKKSKTSKKSSLKSTSDDSDRKDLSSSPDDVVDSFSKTDDDKKPERSSADIDQLMAAPASNGRRSVNFDLDQNEHYHYPQQHDDSNSQIHDGWNQFILQPASAVAASAVAASAVTASAVAASAVAASAEHDTSYENMDKHLVGLGWTNEARRDEIEKSEDRLKADDEWSKMTEDLSNVNEDCSKADEEQSKTNGDLWKINEDRSKADELFAQFQDLSVCKVVADMTPFVAAEEQAKRDSTAGSGDGNDENSAENEERNSSPLVETPKQLRQSVTTTADSIFTELLESDDFIDWKNRNASSVKPSTDKSRKNAKEFAPENKSQQADHEENHQPALVEEMFKSLPPKDVKKAFELLQFEGSIESPKPKPRLPSHLRRELSLNLSLSSDLDNNDGKKKNGAKLKTSVSSDFEFEVFARASSAAELTNRRISRQDANVPEIDLNQSSSEDDLTCVQPFDKLDKTDVEKAADVIGKSLDFKSLGVYDDDDDDDEDDEKTPRVDDLGKIVAEPNLDDLDAGFTREFAAAVSSKVIENKEDDDDNDDESVTEVGGYKSFLARLIDDKRVKAKKSNEKLIPSRTTPPAAPPAGVSKKEQRPKSAGKIQSSAEPQRHKRHWEKSNLAWNSFNPGELNTWSSLDVRKSEKQGSRPSSGKKKQRPASADVKRPNSGTTKKHMTTTAASRSSSWLGPAGAVPKEMELEPPRLRVPPILTNATIRKLPAEKYREYVAMSPRISHGDASLLLCLPEEVLLHILSYLPHQDLKRVSQTCSHLHRIANDDWLWKSVYLLKKQLNDSWLSEIAAHRPHQVWLVQCTGSAVTAHGLRALFRHSADSLQDLNVCGCHDGSLTGDTVLLHAASRCSKLKHLDISWTNVNDTGLEAVAENADKLVSVTMNGCQGITDTGIESLVRKHGKTLTSIELFGCFNVTQRGTKLIGKHCPNLTKLNLGQCYKITDQAISELAPSLTKLKHLDIRGCKHVKDMSIHKIVRHCVGLESIALANVPGITNSAVVEIATYLPQIRSIDISGCKQINDIGVRTLASSCPTLTYIDISSTAITHRSLSVIADQCRHLQTLKVNFCKDLTEDVLIKVARNIRRLCHLHVFGVNALTDTTRIMNTNAYLTVHCNSSSQTVRRSFTFSSRD